MYEIKYEKPGKVVIFSNGIFTNEQTNEILTTKPDIKIIEKVFQNLNFKIETHTDKTSTEVKSIIGELSKNNFKDDSCFICFITGHGTIDSLLASDKNEIKVEEFIDPFKTNVSLHNKPKLFFIDACRGNQTIETSDFSEKKKEQEEELVDKLKKLTLKLNVKEETDLLIGFSSTPGFVSKLDKNGSFYIQTLCKNIERSMNHKDKLDIKDILTLVNKDLSTNKHQVSIAQDTFRKKFYFQKPSIKLSLKEDIIDLSVENDSVVCLKIINESILVSGSEKGIIKIWDLNEKEKPKQTITDNDSITVCCIETCENKPNEICYLACAFFKTENTDKGTIKTGKIKIWILNLKDFKIKEIKYMHEDSVLCLKSLNNYELDSGTKKYALAIGSRDNSFKNFKIWDSENNKILNKTEAIGSRDNSLTNLKIWDLENNKMLKEYNFGSNINCIEMLNSNILAIGCNTGKIIIFNGKKEEKIPQTEQYLSNFFYPVTCILRINKAFFASGYSDQTIKIWNYENETCIAYINTLGGNKGSIQSLQIIGISDELYLVSVNSNHINIWDWKNFILLANFNAIHFNNINCLQIKKPSIIISGSYDGTIKISEITDI
ncbi:unnamed protein product [Brachionus calyciflorus]|uniref:Caspase family p20 domain-containing protein n=1 Tax=Brachionus calyciflorus TaxID=104777 RepID=A0A814HE13_9BILA|nr:unnamed protein product [Brachionus calyciflorus]